MDTLRINGLRFYGYHGETAVEKEGGQVFEVDVEIRFDQRLSAATDDLSKGVDVREVYRRIREVVQGPSRDLVETVAQDLADSLLEIQHGAEEEGGGSVKMQIGRIQVMT